MGADDFSNLLRRNGIAISNDRVGKKITGSPFKDVKDRSWINLLYMRRDAIAIAIES